VLWVAIALPFLATLGFVLVHGVDVPYYDQWLFVPTLKQVQDGSLRFADLWARHNQHRILIPKLVMILLAKLSGWDTRWELVGNWLLLVVTFLGVRRIVSVAGKRDVRLGYHQVAIAALLCTWQQWENLLWGWQLTIFLSVAALVWALVLLGREQPRWIGASLLGIVSSYSFGSGFLVWPLGAVLLWTNRMRRTERSWLPFVLWCVTAAVTVGLHLLDYDPTADLTSRWTWERFVELPVGVATVLGLPLVGPVRVVTPLAGVLGIALFVVVCVRLLRQSRSTVNLSVVMLGGFALASAVLVGIGRFDYADNARVSRYATFGAFLWVADYAGLWLDVAATRRVRHANVVVQALIVLGLLSGQPQAWSRAAQHRADMERNREILVSGVGKPEDITGGPYTNYVTLGIGRRMLLDLGWSVFRDPKLAAETRRRLEPPIVLSSRRTGAATMLRVTGGRAGRFVAIYVFANRRPVLLASGVMNASGSYEFRVPNVQLASGTTVKLIAATINQQNAVTISEPLELRE